MYKIGAIALICLAAAGCATVESRTAQGGGVGFSYMAPMRFLTVNAVRAAPVSAAALERAREAYHVADVENRAAQAALEAAHNAAVEARTLATATTGAAQAARETAALNKEADERVARVRAAAAETAFDRAKKSLDDLVAATAANPGTLRETVEVTMGSAVGDPSARFVARINDSAFRSARGRIVVGQNGLLQSANVVADGQVDEIIVGIAESLVALSQGARSVGAPEGMDTHRAPPICTPEGGLTQAQSGALAPTTLSITFDPINTTEVSMVNHALCEAGFSYRIRVANLGQRTLFSHVQATTTPTDEAGRISQAVERAYQAGAESVPTREAASDQRVATALSLQQSVEGVCPARPGAPANTPRTCNGLVYRQNQPMHIDIIKYDTASMGPAYVERSFTFSVPNAAPVDVLPYGDAIFVTRRNDVGFVDGSLVSLDFDHPSEVSVAAGVPFRALQAAGNALSQVLQLRVNLESKEAELARAIQAAEAARTSGEANAQITNLQNMQRILELQLAVERARQSLREAEAAGETTPD